MIKQIFDQLSSDNSTLKKQEILNSVVKNDLLKSVFYLTYSKRIKFYIKQIPDYIKNDTAIMSLEDGLLQLQPLSNRVVTGNAASNHLKWILESLHKDDAFIIERIIEKDCKLGAGTKLINKTWPDLIEKTGYMGCKPYSRKLVDKLLSTNKQLFSQVKMDGQYVNTIIRSGDNEMVSRAGESTNLEAPSFLNDLINFPDCVLNGELTIDDVPRFQSNGMINSLISINTKKINGEDYSKDLKKFESKHMPYREALDRIKLTCWDILTIDEYYNKESKTPYNQRLDRLTELTLGCKQVNVVETRIVSSIEEILQHFEEVAGRGEEGTVVKSMVGTWTDGKPNWQIKIKKEINLDLRIVSFNYGTGKNSKLISSVNVESADGKLKTSPCGMTEDDMDYVTANMNNLIDKILQIKCSGLSTDSNGNYSVLHPVYEHIRTDKKEANTLNECIEINESTSLLN